MPNCCCTTVRSEKIEQSLDLLDSLIATTLPKLAFGFRLGLAGAATIRALKSEEDIKVRRHRYTFGATLTFADRLMAEIMHTPSSCRNAMRGSVASRDLDG